MIFRNIFRKEKAPRFDRDAREGGGEELRAEAFSPQDEEGLHNRALGYPPD